MTTVPDPAALQILLDKQAITELMLTRARAADRKDVPLALTCYHPEATEDHGGFVGSAREFINNAPTGDPNHPVKKSWHGIVSTNATVDGDEATAETYVLAILRYDFRGRLEDGYVAGRYLSNLVRWQGRWVIKHRTFVFDLTRIDDHVEESWEAQQLDASRLRLGSTGGDDPLYEFVTRGTRVQ